MLNTTDTPNQPSAGASAPPIPSPAAPAPQVTPIARASSTAANGNEPSEREYWKQPTSPSRAPRQEQQGVGAAGDEGIRVIYRAVTSRPVGDRRRWLLRPLPLRLIRPRFHA